MNNLKRQVTGVIAMVFFILCANVLPAVAQSASDDTWKFGAEIYMWGASIGGTTGSGSDLDIDFDDILDDLNIGFMGAVGARKGKWSFLMDAVYMDMDAHKSQPIYTRVELSAWVLTPSVGYTLIETEQGSLNLFFGARYLYLDADLTVKNTRFVDSSSVWDGIIGARGQVNLSEKWYLPYYLDIGTGDSDFTWQTSAGIGYRFSKCDVVLAYRYLDWDFESGDAIDDMNISGPFLGVKFIF